MDPLRHSGKLDGNQRVKLLVAVEVMERNTKAKGRRNGALGYVGLAVLRCLLYRFHNKATGLCCPSIDTIQRATGLCRQSVITGIQRLEAAKVLVVTRRIVRISAIGRDGRHLAEVRQGSNLYAFQELPAQVPLEVGRRRVFTVARVHRAGSNHNTGLPTREELRGLPAFSPGAIAQRRAAAGWR